MKHQKHLKKEAVGNQQLYVGETLRKLEEKEKLEESENVAENVVKKHVEKENTKPKEEKIEYI